MRWHTVTGIIYHSLLSLWEQISCWTSLLLENFLSNLWFNKTCNLEGQAFPDPLFWYLGVITDETRSRVQRHTCQKWATHDSNQQWKCNSWKTNIKPKAIALTERDVRLNFRRRGNFTRKEYVSVRSYHQVASHEHHQFNSGPWSANN